MSNGSSYSASVVLTLVVGKRQLALSHVNPSNVVVCDACEPIPPTEAKLIVEIDRSAAGP